MYQLCFVKHSVLMTFEESGTTPLPSFVPWRLRERAALSEDAGCAWEQDPALFSPARVVKDQSKHGRFSGNQRPIS